MKKIEIFRSLNSHLPKATERIIQAWGSPEVEYCIDSWISDAHQAGITVTFKLIELLETLKSEHFEEFPEFAALTYEIVAEKLRNDESFNIINNRFPHIGRVIIMKWGKPSFGDYINSLFQNNRDGKRQGFPTEVISAIFKISMQHDFENPNQSCGLNMPWDVSDA